MARRRRSDLRLVGTEKTDAPRAWRLYDYVKRNGRNVIKKWIAGLQKADRARLNARLDMLRQNGDSLPPNMLTDTREPRIKEIVVNGRVAVRALLCKGPVDMESEFTILFGAIEQNRKYVPPDALERAEGRRLEVEQSPDERRVPHEDVA